MSLSTWQLDNLGDLEACVTRRRPDLDHITSDPPTDTTDNETYTTFSRLPAKVNRQRPTISPTPSSRRSNFGHSSSRVKTELIVKMLERLQFARPPARHASDKSPPRSSIPFQ